MSDVKTMSGRIGGSLPFCCILFEGWGDSMHVVRCEFEGTLRNTRSLKFSQVYSSAVRSLSFCSLMGRTGCPPVVQTFPNARADAKMALEGVWQVIAGLVAPDSLAVERRMYVLDLHSKVRAI